ncbi:hypothetical protein WYO_5016 [Methylobacterium sp. GXF4]|uniref:CBASS cGAMP synthase n=1 Tax=Methylobacterium sp. GXF4 TaxID=1096546 RepID=UPI00026986EF|nr:hypothetical protein [Methylobacterium sp. GXF4]EIZ82377.1 hypothetical protein WYO_5016 [Methylobacterium sp. GXF4]
MTLANAHALFTGLKTDPSFLANLTISDRERKALLEARQEIRTTLKNAAARIPIDDTYWQADYTRKVAARQRPQIQIKFMTQGSFAYGTLNAPAQKPAQEIDLDDGMYVPVDFLESGEPSLAAKQLFKFAEEALKPLCEKQGWSLDDTKDCCVRVKLWPGAHVDLPIYSIPRDRFVQLRENMERTATAKMTFDSIKGSWKLPSDKIMLAHRNGVWKQSDPQQLHDWVDERVDRYGPIYRRLSRFFKGWRDHTWEKSALSSLCLMCAIDEALKRIDGFPTESRDDEITMEVAKLLPEILGGKVSNPVIKELCINEWDQKDREAIVDGAKALRDEMTAALERTGDAEQVVIKLQKRFGVRIPYRPDAVKIAPKIAAIQKAPAAVVAAPRVTASTSG